MVKKADVQLVVRIGGSNLLAEAAKEELAFLGGGNTRQSKAGKAVKSKAVKSKAVKTTTKKVSKK